MTRSSLVSFLLGAVAAVALYEATGFRFVERRSPPVADGTPAVSAASSPVAGSASATVPLVRRASASSDSGALSRATTEASEAKARAEFAEHQLEMVEGRTAEWPADVAPQFKKESVEKQLKEFVVDRGIAKIRNIDCSEYPCIGILQLTDSGPDANKSLRTALNEMVQRDYTGEVVLSISNSRTEQGSNAVNLAAVSIVPNDDELRTRVRHRTKLGLDEHGPN